VSRMTSHCTGTVQMREESESRIRKWEEMWFKTTVEDRERERGAAVTCDGRLFHRRAVATENALLPTVVGWVHQTFRDIDEAERSRRLASVSVNSILHWMFYPYTDMLTVYLIVCCGCTRRYLEVITRLFLYRFVYQGQASIISPRR